MIDSIVELGFHRASTNEVARRAGVTWGVIQYHFGTRENLLLATLRFAVAEHVEQLRQAVVTGDTITKRMESLATFLWNHYGSDAYMAHLQIITNLLNDPQTAADTVVTLESQVGFSRTETFRLIADAAAPLKLNRREIKFVFAALRGVALSDLVARASHPDVRSDRNAMIPMIASAVADHLLASRGETDG